MNGALVRRANNKSVLVALLAMAALSAVATEVAAHARVKRANPAVGGAVTASAAPTELQVWFTEALEPALSTIEVVDRAGTRMDRGDVRIDPDDHTQLRVSLLPLPPGQYRVIWRVVSIDTHFRSGSFPFRVDP
jgi:copper resistance protein C